MIKAKHHWFLYPFFVFYGWLRIKLHFKKVRIIGDNINSRLPIFVISNHFSWWDGFFISSLNMKKFHKKFHVMMLEEQLLKHWYFSQTGAFSIKKNSKSIMDSLNYTVELLENPENLVTFFPQGKFESLHQNPLHFENGLAWLLKNLKKRVQVIFVANLVEYFESPKPQLFIYYKEYDYINKNMNEIEKDYNKFYLDSYSKNLTLKNI